MDNIPTAKEELERKTIEFLEAQVHRSESGRLAKEDLALLGRSLWTVTSGLVDAGVLDLCALVGKGARARNVFRRYVGQGKVITVAWAPDSAGFAVISINATTLEKTIRKAPAEIGEREAQIETLIANLARAGYVEIS